MLGKRKRYIIGQFWYTKKSFKNLKENEKVEIKSIYKKGRKTFVDVEDINSLIVTGVSVKILRKHPR